MKINKYFSSLITTILIFLFCAGIYYLLYSYNAKINGKIITKTVTKVSTASNTKNQPLGAVMNNNRKKQDEPMVVVITTGGTIAAIKTSEAKGATPAIRGNKLISRVPELKDYAKIKVHEYSNIDSKDMSPEDWINISRLANDYLNKDEVTGVVIVHGTDTMEYTAFFLEYTITSNKPCVLTGAMLASSEPNPDGPRNLISAVRVAADPKTPDNLVGVVFNNWVISGIAVKKTHSTNLDAFQGGSHGYLANIDSQKVSWLNIPLKHKKFNLVDKLPRVDILNVYPGIDEVFARAAIEADTKGVVVTGYGTGNTNVAIANALEPFFANNIPVVIDSVAPFGSSLPSYGGVGGGSYYKQKGALFGNVIRPGKARILLMLALANNIDIVNLKYFMDNTD